MKIELINENSIRCTINRKEFEDYKIGINELIEGSGNTNKLFKRIMLLANEKFGFEPNENPLIIEASASMPGDIVFTITKVDGNADISGLKKAVEEKRAKALNKVANKSKSREENKRREEQREDESNILDRYREGPLWELDEEDEEDVMFIFSGRNAFSNLRTASKMVYGIYQGISNLYFYKDAYILTIDKKTEALDRFVYAYDVISEYADATRFSDLDVSLFLEHGDAVFEGDALKKLAEI